MVASRVSITASLTLITAIHAVASTALFAAVPPAQGLSIDEMGHVLPMRRRPEVINRMLADRLDNLLPKLMRETGIDLWVVINREYAEDPVYLTLVPAPVFSARRTTMLVFFDRGEGKGVERLTVSRYPLGGLYEPAWEGGAVDEQWTQLAKVIAERNPKRIGVNVSRDWAHADGLTASLRDRLLVALGPSLGERVTSAERLCVRWLETRTPKELEVYPHIVGIARRVIAEAFSSKVITPGATTTADIAWYIRERFEELDLRPWFQPYVNIQRRGFDCDEAAPYCGDEGGVVLPGDVLHTDVGICYLRLCTDTQEMAYVLRLGEEDAPPGIKHGMVVGNKWQDLLTGAFITGRTGNEILAATRAAADKAGIWSRVYSHPLGFFGHAAGPTIGMWDNQGPTPVRGDWKLYPNTGYAIEGNVKVRLSEWDGQWLQVKLEQSAVFDGDRVLYLAGRQTHWHLIR